MSTSTAPHAAPIAPPSARFADRLLDLLHHLGVREAFGLVGGAIAPLCDALGASPITSYQLRHEAGCVFAAVEASLATGRPTLVFVTTGPGLTNALTGAIAARWEGAKVILVSGATSPAQRGRWAVQETSPRTIPAGVFTAGPIFDVATLVEHPAELATIAARLAAGVARPGGFVAHLALPIALQQAPSIGGAWPTVQPQPPAVAAPLLDDGARALAAGSMVIWAGFGARAAAADVVALAEHTGARVMCSPRGKGIMPEHHPLYLGVTGCGGHDAVERALAEHPADHILVLGSRLGEFTSCWAAGLRPRRGFVHVDLDAEVFGAAFPDVPTLGVVGDVGEVVRGLRARLPAGSAPTPVARPAPLLALRDVGPVRPRALMAALQRVVVEDSAAAVIAESGNSFAWTNHELRFARPGRYRVSGLWGSMGHATSGVVGLALARADKAVAVVGDGAMLMMNEVSSAVQYRAPAVWVVLNDGVMGIVDRGMQLIGLRPFQTALPRTDFVALARALGADGVRVERETELAAALTAALAADGPFIVDVDIDPTEAAPIASRISTLCAMGAKRA